VTEEVICHFSNVWWGRSSRWVISW